MFFKISTFSLLYLFQSFLGFVLYQHQGISTALLKVVNDLLLATDEGKLLVLVLLDLFGAFDTIDHDVLLHRLQHVLGFQGTMLSWFRSDPTQRFQIV